MQFCALGGRSGNSYWQSKTRPLVQSTRDKQHGVGRHKTASITSSQESLDLKKV